MLLLLNAWVYRYMRACTDRWMAEWMKKWRNQLSTNDWATNEHANEWISKQTKKWMHERITMCRRMKESTVGCCMVTMIPSSSLTLSVSCCKTSTPACPTSSQVWVRKYPKLLNCIMPFTLWMDTSYDSSSASFLCLACVALKRHEECCSPKFVQTASRYCVLPA